MAEATGRHWLWRVMGVLSLGGGFTGLGYVCSAIFNGEGPIEFWITVAFAAFAYGMGVWSGLRVLERRPGAERWNLIYWWIQVPYINTPVLAVTFYTGAKAILSASLGWDQSGTDEMNFSANAIWGTNLEWSYMQGDVPWEFGINALALVLAIWGGRLWRKEASTAKLEIW